MRSAVLSGDVWGRTVDAARAGQSGDELVAEVARQLTAPVRGTIVAARGDVITTTRLTLSGGHALLVTQGGRCAADGRQRFTPERRVTVAAVEDLWAALTEAVPPVEVLRAPAHGGADRGEVVARGAQGVALVDAADARLDVVFEAYDGEARREVWARAWAVVDGRLLDLRSGDGELVVRERVAGAVAAELEWALVGAVAAGGAGTGGGSGAGRGGGSSSGGGGFLGWLGDRAEDVNDWVGDRLEAIADDTLNAWEAAAQLWDATGGTLLDGETPRMTEVLASGIQLTGAAAGSLITTATFGMVEANVFDDGHAVVTGVDRVEKPAPSDLESVMESVTDAYQEDGTVQITLVDGPDGPRAIVAIPGMETWNPSAGENPADLTGYLVTAGGGRSTWSEGVALAIDAANLPPGTEIVLVGHSQGGMTSTDLASDSEFVSKYHVTGVVAYGSPIDSERIDPSVNVLEVQHSGDVVPKLDLGDWRVDGTFGTPQDSGHHTTVTLDDPDGPSWPFFSPARYHSHGEYAQSVGGSSDPGLAAYEARLRESGFLTDDASRVTTLEVRVGRED